MAPHLLPLFPEHHCYVEPFCGAAALFFLKEPSKVEVLNDLNDDIVNLYRVVKYHLEELHSQFKWVLSSRKNYQWLLETPSSTLTDIQKAARFLYLQKLAFGGKVDGRSYGTSTTCRPKFNIFTLEQDLADAHFRLSDTNIEHLDWQDVITKYDRPDTFFYCDPPYWKTEGYGVTFPFENYIALSELARSIKGRMIISINDHPDIRQLFSGLFMREIDYKYTVGGSHNRTECVELIYGNWQQHEHLPGQINQTTLF